MLLTILFAVAFMQHTTNHCIYPIFTIPTKQKRLYFSLKNDMFRKCGLLLSSKKYLQKIQCKMKYYDYFKYSI